MGRIGSFLEACLRACREFCFRHRIEKRNAGVRKLYASGKVEAAFAAAREVTALRRRHAGADSLDYALGLSDEGFLHAADGDAREARRLLQSAFDIRRGIGPETPAVLDTLHLLFIKSATHGYRSDAIAQGELLVDMILYWDPLDDARLAKAAEPLLDLLHAAGGPEAAMLALARRLAAARRRMGDSWATVRALNVMGVLERKAGNLSAARCAYDEALARVQSEQLPETERATCHNNLGCLAREEGDLGMAVHHLAMATEIRARRLGEVDPRTLESRFNLNEAKAMLDTCSRNRLTH